MNFYLLNKNKPVLPHLAEKLPHLRQATRINPSSIQGVGGWMCTGDVQRGESVRLPYLWRTTRINSFSELGVRVQNILNEYVFKVPEPRQVLRRKFNPVNKITLGTFLD